MNILWKRLTLGIILILAGSAILLTADSGKRSKKGTLKNIAIIQYSSAALVELTVAGIVDGLANEGFVEGKTARINIFNAQADLPVVNSMAQAIVAGHYDIAITTTTPCLQAFASVNRDGKTVQVFGAVTDPFSAGIGLTRGSPFAHPRHLVGIGSFEPVKEVFRVAKQISPELKRVGTVWNAAEACSAACLVLAREVCAELGIELIEAFAENSPAVQQAVESVVARKPEALWLGCDNTVEVAAGVVASIAARERIPVFSNNPGHIDIDGVLFALGSEYREVGKITGELGGRVLNGLDTAKVPIENVVPKQLAVSLSRASTLTAGWKIPANLIEKAAVVIDSGGKKSTSAKLFQQ